MKYLFTLAIVWLPAFLFSQQPTQNIRGRIAEAETDYPLGGVEVALVSGDSIVKKTYSDTAGIYLLPAVTVGKYTLRASYDGYQPASMPVTVNSGKESITDIKLLETVGQTIGEVVVTARKRGQVINEMATVSSQQFSVEETQRYAGSRGDPARMASNFAGVQGADDSRNDIVIRGNSPLGVIYKVEGVDIPNPSHFAVSGSMGGPVSIINNKSLSNSDFFMSAFPAEYGNSLSGIFDLKLRKGNDQRHEFTAQFGLLGTEVAAEGPLNKKRGSSYLVMGRYSTLSIFQFMGIRIGTDAVPVYGDGAFKFNFPMKKGGTLSFWGIGGKSNINILVSEQKTYSDEIYGQGDRDQYFGTTMFTSGVTYKKTLNEKNFLTATVSGAFDEQHSHHTYLIRSLDTTYSDGNQAVNIRVDSMYPLMGYQFKTTHGSAYLVMNHKFNAKHLLRYGFNAEMLYFQTTDSLDQNGVWQNRWNYSGAAALLQPFVQYKWRLSDKMDVTAGLHAQYFTLSNSLSPAEPRVGWKCQFTRTQKVYAGGGLHSQTQPYYTYLYHKTDVAGNEYYENMKMGFSKAWHAAIGYEKSFGAGFVMKTEVYYQYLFHIPVTVTPSAFSIINQGSGFSRIFPDKLQNTGTGKNYGVELTIQKYFDQSFYILATGSLYESKYKGSDGIERNTSYAGLYTGNLLGGKEFKIGKRQVIGIGTKLTVAGGKRYGYVNVAASQAVQDLVYLDSGYNSRQFKDYFRLDFKISWKLNTTKFTHEFGLDLVNVLNTRNILSLTYAPNLANPSAEPIAQKTQLGFLPIFYYRIDFKLGKKE